jgi:hypothetical protein
MIIAAIIAVVLFLSAVGFNLPNIGLTASAQSLSTCLNRTNIDLNEMHWIYVPESASQLHTEENYYFLAGQLISNGVVDASTCPSNGLTLNGYANACGMDVAKEKVIVLQNAVDEAILKAYTDVGVPPVLLKQMIRTESQFWPSYYSNTHYGYGHITNIGMRKCAGVEHRSCQQGLPKFCWCCLFIECYHRQRNIKWAGRHLCYMRIWY